MPQRTPPAIPIAEAIRTIYARGLTTSTGGNISLRGDGESLWMTPAGFDKAEVAPEDIVHVDARGTVTGRHRPSSELPFHRRIYDTRPDIDAIVHAHPVNLVAFCVCRQTPEPQLFAPAARLCDPIAYAPYELTGTDRLADAAGHAFEGGAHVALLENHGVLTTGATLDEAVARLEALDLLAEIQINLARLGAARAHPPSTPSSTVVIPGQPADEGQHLAELHWLDARTRATRLLRGIGECITSRSDDGQLLVLCDGTITTGATGPRAELHARVHANDPAIRVVISASPPAATALAITGRPLQTHAIPESHVVLRQVHSGSLAAAPLDRVDLRRPVLLLDQLGAVVAGRTAFEAFDRLEVLEATARTLIAGSSLGPIHALSTEQIDELNQAFDLS